MDIERYAADESWNAYGQNLYDISIRTENRRDFEDERE